MKSIFLALSIFPQLSLAADISIEKITGIDAHAIVISGSIQSSDAESFTNRISGIKNAVVILDSAGGDIPASLAIGRSIRGRGFSTGVPDNTLCTSSCALIWLAGVNRFAEESSFLGFHAAYIYKDGRASEEGVANALVGAYLNELGLSESAIIFATSAPPEGVERLDKNKAELVGISYSSVRDPIKGAGSTRKEFNPSTRTDFMKSRSPHDPILAVQRFYHALSIADGNMASAQVTPEKRGNGPFNEKNITSFFRSLEEPLVITSIEQVSDDTVKVQYKYRATRTQCIGIAIVETEYFFGNTLIKSIRANC
jgi:hypothetical protein